MEKLTIEQVQNYLAYNVDILIFSNVQPTRRGNLTPSYLGDLSGVKLILKPLKSILNQDFTKIVNHPDDQDQLLEAIEDNSPEYLPYNIVLELLKRHYDVFYLIEQGLAVDIKTT